MPKVSLCLPTLNRGELFGKTLRSLVAQTFADLEILVIDNASDTDEARRTVDEVADPRVRYIRQEKRVPMGANWNRGLDEAKGQYVGIFHDDDVYHPLLVTEEVARLDSDPSLSFVHAMTLRVDDDGVPLGLCDLGWPEKVTGTEFRRRMALEPRRSLVEAPSVLMRATALRRAGPFVVDWIQDTDAEMWMRLAEHGNVGYVRKPLVNVRLRLVNSRPTPRHVRSLEERLEMAERSRRILNPAERALAHARIEAVVSESLLWMVLRGDEETRKLAREKIVPRLSLPVRAALSAALAPGADRKLKGPLEQLARLRRFVDRPGEETR